MLISVLMIFESIPTMLRFPSDKAAATTAFATANKQIHSLVSKGFIKKTTAARKVSRLHKMVNAVA